MLLGKRSSGEQNGSGAIGNLQKRTHVQYKWRTEILADLLTCEALPAWVEPVFEKTGLSLLRLSTVTPSRMPSSSVTVISVSSPVLGSTTLVLTGTISSRKLPAFWALTAFWKDLAANSSCC